MISVTVTINGKVLYHRTAVNVSEAGLRDDQFHTYAVDTGVKILHKRDLGAIPLVKKMLDTIKEKR